MEPITTWNKERVSDWLKGLDTSLQQYPFAEWQLSGLELLQLSAEDLERLGVHKIGHQELLLEAVEKLCSLTFGMGGESLRGLTEKLRAVAHTLQMGIQSHWRQHPYDGHGTTKLPSQILEAVVELIASAKGLFSLLNRYQFSQLRGYTASEGIIAHCRALGTTVNQDAIVFDKERDIIGICRQLVAVCDDILNSSPEALLAHTAQLESVDLVPTSPSDHLSIEIKSTGSSNHFVTGSVVESAAEFCEKILAGDEVIQVNDQIVVGWSRANLLKKLQENPNGVTLVLKKVPGSLRRRVAAQQEEEKEGAEEEEEEEEETENQRHSIFERVAASVRSLSFRKAIHGPAATQPSMGQEESELSSNRGVDGSLTVPSQNDQQGGLSPLSVTGDCGNLDKSRLSPGLKGDGSRSPRSPSPLSFGLPRSPSPRVPLGRASVSSCPEMGGNQEDKDAKRSCTKGMTTVLSRRRVSCRELGRPDCDGWLWKKRKESNVFLAQKWQRFWFVLKGPSLYWYTTPQEEKAEGLVQIASYNIESAGEHKRKYVFQMCHERFQNFFFAAENVTDMSKWINCLITAIQKHKRFNKDPPDSEEECYSETESEDEASPSPRRRNKKMQSNTLPRPKGKKNKVPLSSSTTGGSKGTGTPDDEMGVMFNRLKEGGVSLIGQEQPQTHDHFRKSFIRRNKNPIINEKAHTLRALQSTLKAKEAELQLINKILEDDDLTASKYRQWKESNEELCQEIERLALLGASKDEVITEKDTSKETDTPGQMDTQGTVTMQTVATGTVTAVTEGACRLSLCEGEQLVDAEPSDILLEIPGSPMAGTSPVLDLSLGSLQDSIKKQLHQMADDASGGESAENYFYI